MIRDDEIIYLKKQALFTLPFNVVVALIQQRQL